MTKPDDTWQPITVTMRSKDRSITPNEIEGFVPYSSCPLAIHLAYSWDSHKDWKLVKGDGSNTWWMITHRPTGFNLGFIECPEKEQAQQLLMASAPAFPGWWLATGDSGDPATSACRVWFRAACAAMGIEVGESVRA